MVKWARIRIPSGEFVSSEISQTLRDFIENSNRLNTFCTNLKAHIILTPHNPRIGTGHVGHAKIEISQRIRTQVPLCESKILSSYFSAMFLCAILLLGYVL